MKLLTLQEQYILLAVYHLQKNAYLVTIRDYLHKAIGKRQAIGTIYAPLDRLRKNGYLESRVGEPSGKVGGRSIKYYSLTKDGLAILAEMKKIQDDLWIGFTETAI